MTRAIPVVGMVAAATVVAVAAAWFLLADRPRAGGGTAPAITTTTAPVTRGVATQRVEISGSLGFQGAFTVANQLPAGILVRAAAPGTVVSRGQELFAVSGISVRLLYGHEPAYRAMQLGMPDGPDVRELESNLRSLGFDPGSVDDHFSAATSWAVCAWQRHVDEPCTGTIQLGEIAFLPGPIRVSGAGMRPGGTVQPGTDLLHGTSTRQVVHASVTVDQRDLVKVGDRVQVTLPGSTPIPGRVLRVGQVALEPSADGSGEPTISVTIALARGTSAFDHAPAQVAITVATRRGVLLVPVTALLAKPGGGYQVRVGRRLVDVTPGLYDDTTGAVEVSGALHPGQKVEVPAG
ncbi:MAG: peptidoglycan-binding protein [Streptomyces sp.]|nr:peptidoglycan-binding protein [Streptomyces sp.]